MNAIVTPHVQLGNILGEKDTVLIMEFRNIEKVHTRDKQVLEARERYWRKQYNAIYKGLNKNAT